MATYQKAPKTVGDLALKILKQFETHKPVLDAGVTIDFIFAYGKQDDNGDLVGDAIRHGGVKALGLCRILSLKDRAAGRMDAEILIDGDWWGMAREDAKKALLDHELHHIGVKTNKQEVPITDDLSRPKLFMRKHDFQYGWFSIIAERHGKNSQECQQAKHIMDMDGQLFWPGITDEVKSKSIDKILQIV